MPKIQPQPGPQEQFLSSKADVVFFGGAAGGGKTYALLLEPLRHIMTVEGFGAVIFRRETPQITSEGGMWDEAKKIYPHFDADPRVGYLDWTFSPHENTVKFAHMEKRDDYLNWKGAQIAFLGFDQVEDFERKQFIYMLSRNRSTCGVRPYVRCTYNPVPPDEIPGGWIHEFVGWYLDEKGEYPDPEKAGIIRWFVNYKDELYWFDSEEAATKKFPHIPPKTFTFIPAYVDDNKILLEKDPGYLANLYALDNIDHERLLRGNHQIKPSTGSVINRDWFSVLDHPPKELDEVVRFWDIAASERKKRKHRSPATAGVLMGRWEAGRSPSGEPLNNYIVLDMVEQQFDPAKTDSLIKAVAIMDGTDVKQRWEQEPGASGKRDTAHIAALLDGFDAKGVPSRGDKLTRGRAFAAQAYAKNVFLLRGEWNEGWLNHMHAVPDGYRMDIFDASVGAYNELSDPAAGGEMRQAHVRGRKVRRNTRRVARIRT